MANPFKAIWHFFVGAFHWVIKNSPLKSFAQQYFASIVLAVVKELDASNLSGPEKRAAAFSRIEAAALAKGFELEKAGINWLIEMAVANLRGLVGPQL